MANFVPRIRNKQNELGLGRHITTQGRLINPDGSFNVQRQHVEHWDNLYYNLVTMPLWKFLLSVLTAFVMLNAIFATIYLFLGPQELSDTPESSWMAAWLHAYFFSSQTITTIGYGHISPTGLVGSLLASLESFLGLLFFAIISGLLYGRFSRPTAKVLFSDNALISPYKGGQGIMFRIVNPRKSELIEAEVEVSLAINQKDEETGEVARRFFSLDLEISRIAFFSLSWTIVHAIVEGSPLYGLSEQQLIEANAEMLVLFKGNDESTEQLVHARRSYISSEVVWNAKFQPMMSRSADNRKMLIYSNQVGNYELL